MNKIQIEYKNINELTPYENNPRNNDGSVDYVVNSIKEFGFRVPIIIDKNNTIIAGHTRYKAAKKLGLEEVPTIKVDDLTDKQIKAYRIADNKVGEFSSWDISKLDLELEELGDIDMGQFGVDDINVEIDYSDKNKEYDIEDFSDDKFQAVCPKCGFKFDPQNK